MQTPKSPLRYPGGKTRAIKTIVEYFPKNLSTIISPFIGGGSIELYLASKGVKIIASDAFKPLVEFWQELLSNPYRLANEIQKHFPLAKENFYELQKSHSNFKTKTERAAIYYVLNRASFGGATLVGGMSPSHPRFTQTSIERIRNFKNSNITVEYYDFKNSLSNNENNFAYLDPPYLIKSSLYGNKKDCKQSEFDHEGLANMLKTRKGKWALSYNDCEEIRKLYSEYKIIELSWSYGMSKGELPRAKATRLQEPLC